MPITNDKQITINGLTFSFGEFTANPAQYLPMVTPLFREATLRHKDREINDEHSYLNRLFYLCYYKKGLAAGSDQTVARVTRTRVPRTTRAIAAAQMTDEYRILDALGIDVVKKNPKYSKIVFKNSGNIARMKTEEMDKLVDAIKANPQFKRKEITDMRVGVELEFVGKRGNISDFNSKMNKLVGADRFECPLHYNHNNGNAWVLGTDGSINYNGCDERGYELTSPILDPNSEKDMAELKAVTELVKDVFSGHTNKSCGTHVHMSFDTDMQTEDQKRNLKRYFARSYRDNESEVFDKVVPNNRRENHARFSRSMDRYSLGTRYQKLNFLNDDSRRSLLHLEFRQLDGTLEYDKISSWIKLQKLFAEVTMSNFKHKDELDDNETVKYTIESVLTDKAFNTADVESLLKEGKLAS